MNFAPHSGDGQGHYRNLAQGSTYAALLLTLLWLGGCKQIPTAPEPEPQVLQTNALAQPEPVAPSAKPLPEPEPPPREIVRAAPIAEIMSPGVPIPPGPSVPGSGSGPIGMVPPTAGPRVSSTPEPQGGSQARWIPSSQRPAWLNECLSPTQIDEQVKIQRTALPEYPQKLALDDVEGRVIVLFQVSKSGQLGHYLVQPGAHPALVKPSVAAMRRWKFSVPTWQGNPVTACFVQAFRYQLAE